MIALRYHESTKHYFNRFARSLGYLDWATQPDPFRRYDGAPLSALARSPVHAEVPYAALFDGSAPAAPFSDEAIAECLRCSMGLSAWKQYQRSRWALRVNPSSGNLHPTEAYVVRDGCVCHYAPREHALEERTQLPPEAWQTYTGGRPGLLVALTSILWREAWKYGERAFRYCQHDTGHAIAAFRLSAAMLGWQMTLLPGWGDADLASILGLDRDADYGDAEREEPECLAVITAGDVAPWLEADPAPLVDAARAAVWHGTANRLSRERVAWPAIDEVAEATRRAGRGTGDGERPAGNGHAHVSRLSVRDQSRQPLPGPHLPAARQIILQRRSAVAFDGTSSLPKDAFLAMLQRLQPSAPPWDAMDWPPQIHLLLFVHRVDGLAPGVYAYLRDETTAAEWRAAMRPEFLWEPVVSHPTAANGPNLRTLNDPTGSNGPSGPSGSSDRLFLLLPTDVTWVANRASCDQDIAADGFFSLGMIARFEPALRERGEWFYRRLFWESGVVGQVLYLEAEAAGARATGIGCFYDDAVHDLAGLSGHAWQSLYHFSMGRPVDDERLTTEPGYPWDTPTR